MHPAKEVTAMAPTITDELHAMLVKRADDLEGCPEGSDEECELAAIERAIGAVRWQTASTVEGGSMAPRHPRRQASCDGS